MALRVYYCEDIERALIGGLVLTIRTDGGRDLEYLRGNFAMAEHQADVFGCNWSGIVQQVQGRLGGDELVLLDAVGRALPTGDR